MRASREEFGGIEVSKRMRDGKRITLRMGEKRRSILLTSGPYPEKGDLVTIEGRDWTVFKAKDEAVFAKFEDINGKLKQVFP